MLLKYLDINKYRIKHYKKGQIIFKENEECKYVGIVIKGNLTISSFSLDGKEIIYNTISEEELFGHNLIFSNENIYKGNVIANIDSDIVLIDKKELLDILQNNKTFLLSFLNTNSNYAKELNDRIKILSFNNIYDRFMYYLHTNHNVISFTTITNIANYLNTSREALSRLIHTLERNNVITIKNNIIKKRL